MTNWNINDPYVESSANDPFSVAAKRLAARPLQSTLDARTIDRKARHVAIAAIAIAVALIAVLKVFSDYTLLPLVLAIVVLGGAGGWMFHSGRSATTPDFAANTPAADRPYWFGIGASGAVGAFGTDLVLDEDSTANNGIGLDISGTDDITTSRDPFL